VPHAFPAAFAPSGCNPLGPGSDLSCMLPWPSDHFQATTWDASAKPSLAQLDKTTFPLATDGAPIDPVTGGWAALTGFSPSGGCIAYLPGKARWDAP